MIRIGTFGEKVSHTLDLVVDHGDEQRRPAERVSQVDIELLVFDQSKAKRRALLRMVYRLGHETRTVEERLVDHRAQLETVAFLRIDRR